MVAVSATAILNDINVSVFVAATRGGVKSPKILQNAGAPSSGQSFLSALFNQAVSAPGQSVIQCGEQRK
jgi:hypothetical protein